MLYFSKIRILLIKSFSAINRYWNYFITEFFILYEKKIDDKKKWNHIGDFYGPICVNWWAQNN